MEEQVILVDEHDREIGTDAKLSAHAAGKLHRAFSVFIFDTDGNMLLQRRAATKYHSGGLWSNTCCSHPRPGESVHEAAQRRLQEEMGLDCSLQLALSFTYRKELGNGLSEYEYNHVFLGQFNGTPAPNPLTLNSPPPPSSVQTAAIPGPPRHDIDSRAAAGS